MLNTIKEIIKSIFKKFNYRIVKENNYVIFENQKINFLLNTKAINTKKALTHFKKSNSQLYQDLFVLDQHNFKNDGYFVEFGCCDGIHLSNTYLLEKYFNWRGIVCEPAKKFANELKRNRKCFVETQCVYSESNINLLFNESNSGELSSLSKFLPNDKFIKLRKNNVSYEVKTISLNDLLDKYKAPKIFEYLSIDTEGSEYEILKTFNFKNYIPKIITVEHNFDTEKRELIKNLLIKNNYTRVFENISGWDDWYKHDYLGW
jgi:FkbM family methyltransferase